ncbi:hypothetical protein OOC_16809 [Providencia rettgeri Dmel1]|nr:hypothetical protein AM461_18350 [Providencia rettgeri]EKT55215.1 hypothetical protein OOC_16809 [Providencia rettgeri Dmel1]RFT09431.1 hypothetical protein DYB39_13945 [Providencia rettgeri]
MQISWGRKTEIQAKGIKNLADQTQKPMIRKKIITTAIILKVVNERNNFTHLQSYPLNNLCCS